ncbi:MAG: NAD(P)H-dependent oxidoreductase, partial [Limnobacter sp.]|nr:NAD(P)H-dependent oxidoreductase [Limnobacter sp.]
MQVLIVHAHPEPQSFCASMCTEMKAVFESQGHSVEVSDLYAQKFNPVASAADFSEPSNPDYLVYAIEQRHATKQGTLPADIQAEVEKVQKADLVVLNFPMFWFSMPAILKGWVDRVFLSGAFYGGRNVYDRGRMKGKRAWVTFTLGGHEGMFGEGSIHGDLTGILKPIVQGSLGYVGFDVHEPFAAYHVPYIGQDAREEMMESFKKAVA